MVGVSPLSARRRVTKKGPISEELEEFLKAPIRFDRTKPETISRTPRYRPKVLQTETTEQQKSDSMHSARRRAFEIAHRRKADLIEKQTQKIWEEDENLRNWKTRRPKEVKIKDNDKQILESVIKERNDYYISTAHMEGYPGKSPQITQRTLPREIRAITQTSKSALYWN